MSLVSWWQQLLFHRAQVQNAEKREERLRLDYEKAFSGPMGERVLADLAERHGILGDLTETTPGGRMDATLLAYNAGRRRVVADIINYVKAPLFDETDDDESEVREND